MAAPKVGINQRSFRQKPGGISTPAVILISADCNITGSSNNRFYSV